MSEPISGTGAATVALTGVSLYGLLSGADYGVLFGAFAGATFYIASSPAPGRLRQIAYFLVSWAAGVIASGLVGSKLQQWTGYTEQSLDALGAVLVAAVAIRFLTSLNNGDMSWLMRRFRGGGRDGGS
ncbi:phage holin family protein [Tatumella saanichensis]|uniref:phage holin family protein n=1 Tax=Tatumella saanichensis TaxID=480813 RepID=UPI0004A303A2|nr:phage holin family protein [Tatumella saanichensis]